jgi:hypothetical protein
MADKNSLFLKNKTPSIIDCGFTSTTKVKKSSAFLSFPLSTFRKKKHNNGKQKIITLPRSNATKAGADDMISAQARSPVLIEMLLFATSIKGTINNIAIKKTK